MKKAIAIAAVFAAAFCYLSLFATYGVDLADEGTLAYEFERVSEGERPFIDFRPVGTPGVYWVHSTLQGWFGQSLVPGRRVLALVNAGTVALVAAIVAPLVGIAGAFVAAFVFLSMLPVSAGEFAAFNVPYPAWYCAALFGLGMVAGRRFLDIPSDGNALISGLLAGVAFAFKPNAGVLQLAASMLLVLAAIPFRALNPVDRIVAPTWWFGIWLSLLMGVFAAYGFQPATSEAAAFVGPLLFCAILAVRSAGRREVPRSSAALTRVTSTVLVGFLLVTVPWLWSYGDELGARVLFEHLLKVAAGFGAFFPDAHPVSPLVVGGLVVAYIAAFAMPNYFEQQPALKYKVMIAGFGGGLATIAISAYRMPPPREFAPVVMGPFEAFWSYNFAVAVIWLLGVAAWVGIGIAAHSGDRERRRANSILVLAVGSAFLYCQIYPRIEFVRWVTVSPVLVAGGVYLVWILAERWDNRREYSVPTSVAIYAMFVAPLVFFSGLRAISAMDAVIDMRGLRPSWTPAVTLENERAPLWTNVGRSATYSGLNGLVGFLRENSAPDDPVVAFPALEFLPFAADRPGLPAGGYFFPGWFDRKDEARAVFSILAQRPPYVVFSTRPSPHFVRSSAHYFQFTQTVENEYQAIRRFGPFVVFERSDRVNSKSAAAGIGAAPLEFDDNNFPDGDLHALQSPDAGARAAALAKISEYRVEGHSPVLAAMLDDSSEAVRNAAVASMRSAQDANTAVALTNAVFTGGLKGAEGLWALRLASAWSDERTLPLWLAQIGSENRIVEEAALTALASYAGRSFAESFRPGGEAGGVDISEAVDESSRAFLRAAMFDPAADLRLRAFAVRAASTFDGFDAPCPADLGVTLTGRYLIGFARERPGPAVAGVAVDRLAADPSLASRMAVEALVRMKDPDRVLEPAIDRVRDPAWLERLLWVAAATAGRSGAKAALRRAGSGDPAVRAAGLWAGGRRGGKDSAARIRTAAENDPDPEARELAKMAVEIVERK